MPDNERQEVAVSMVEDLVFGADPELQHHLHTIQNDLMATEINNSLKGRPNFNIGYRDPGTGELLAYLLGFEGRIKNTGKQIVYISDFASLDTDPTKGLSNKRAGTAILNNFFVRYSEVYASLAEYPSVVLEARQGETFEFLQKRLSRLAAKVGLKASIEEIYSERVGASTMHRLFIEMIRR